MNGQNSCLECKYADWKRTANGRLHPSGDGKCMYEVITPKLPKAKSFFYNPTLLGGEINRKDEFYVDCPCFEKAQ